MHNTLAQNETISTQEYVLMNASELLLNIGLGIVAGIASGFYTGMVMAKYSSFCQVRLMLFALCRGFRASGVNGQLEHADFPRYTELADTASNLLYLGHKKAGTDALQIFKEVADTRAAIEMRFQRIMLGQPLPVDNPASILSLMEVFQRLSDWQTRSRQLQPSFLTLLSLRPRL